LGGKLYCNWRTIIAPHSIVDYVVVHKLLCHLVHGDHSKKFWKLLETILPDYVERKEWLKVNGRG
jgi:predicted metal-dependent hydrolase